MDTSTASKVALPVATSAEPGATVSDLRILMVEDSEMDAELVKRTLVKGGFRFTSKVVNSRESFVELLKEFHPHVILSDFTMPGFSGEEAIDLARERCPEVPFIFVSGTLGEERAVDLLKRGAWDYVLKDRPARLVPAVARSLELAAELREQHRLEKARRRAERIVSAQNRVLERIARGSPLRTTLNLLVNEIEDQLPRYRGAILVHREEGEDEQLVVGPNLPSAFHQAFRPPATR